MEVVAILLAVMGILNSWLVAPIGRQFGYLFSYHKNFANLSSQVEKLEDRRGDLEQGVAAAERNLQIRKDSVTKWLERATAIKAKVDRILQDKNKADKRLLNPISRYWLGREAVKKARDLVSLLSEGEFEMVAHPRPPPGIVSTRTMVGSEVMQAPKEKIDQLDVVQVQEDPESATQKLGKALTAATTSGSFESRLLIMRDIIEALNDDTIRMIRICGMGGVGKTTMVKEVEKIAREVRMFDEIVFQEFNPTPDLRCIQGYIAQSIGLKLTEGSLSERAVLLSERLSVKNKRILVILDNVWRRSDLEEVGIPLAGEDTGCNLVMTSRSEDVCADIRTQKMFKIGILSDPEALTLFYDTSRNHVYDTPSISLANKILKECGGLPLAIVTIARALVNMGEAAWTAVVRQLEKSALVGEYASVYKTLELSYNFLQTEEIKDFFVLCCLFPEGFDVLVEDLVRYGMGLNLFRNIDNLHEARIRAHVYVETLVHSNLLLRSDKEECVKMHDLVRDFVLSIASKGIFMVRYGDKLKEWPVEDTYEHYTSISLQCNQICELPTGLECPKLKLLKLEGATRITKFPEFFYKGMGELNVLAIKRMFIESPPKSIQLLTNLRTLALNNCKLNDEISIIGDLGKLEVLSFANSYILMLPTEIGKLSRLRLLDLTGCKNLHTIAPGIISSLERLEELYMRGTSFYWSEGTEQTQANFNEVKSLSKLIILETNISHEVLPTDTLFENLEKFKISIGFFSRPENLHLLTDHDFVLLRDEVRHHPFQNSLNLVVDSRVLHQHGIRSLFRKAGKMHLQVKGLETFLHESEIGDSLNLKSLTLDSCNELVHLVNGMPPKNHNNVFPVLDSLHLNDLINLEDIYHVQNSNESLTDIEKIDDVRVSMPSLIPPTPQLASFGNLRELEVRGCNKLENIFSVTIARGLVKLKKLEIVDCEMMKEVVSKSRGDEHQNATVGKIEFPHLKSLSLDSLPKLVALCKAADVIELPKLKELELVCLPNLEDQHASAMHPFFDKVTLTSLENLKIKGMNLPDVWSNQFPPELRKMELNSCDELIAVLSVHSIQRFQHLEKLFVQDCATEVVFDIEEMIVEDEHTFQLLNRLEDVVLYRLPLMTHVWNKGPQGFVGFQRLTNLVVDSCASIRYLFSPLIAKNLVELRLLQIRACRVMETVVSKIDESEDQEPEPEPDIIFFPKLHTLGLADLPCIECLGPWNYISDSVLSGAPNVGSHEANDNCDAITSISSPVFHAKDLSKFFSASTIFEGTSQQPRLPAWPLSNLDYMHVFRCDELLYVFPSESVVTLQNLTTLLVDSCKSLVEIFEADGTNADKGPIVTIQQLEKMTLESLPQLKYIWRHKRVLMLFPNLKDLSITKCDRMRYIFYSSTVTSLVHLKTLYIRGCPNMQEVIGTNHVEGEARMSKLVFPSLVSLHLTTLSNLQGFCLQMCDFDWPSLKFVNICYCEQMTIFTVGHSSTPNLKEIRINGRMFSLDGDLNTTFMRSQQEVKKEANNEPEDQTKE